MNLVFPEGTNIDIAEILQGSNTIHFMGTASKIHLFSSDTMTPNTGTTLAQLTAVEADYPGYVALNLTWDSPQRNPSFGITIEAVMGPFKPSNDTFGGQTINGIFVTGTGADSATLYMSGLLDAPFPLLDTHSALTVNMVFAAPAEGAVQTIA
jgi:hypothetical protein